MRSGAGRITASLLAVALCLLSVGPASATDGGPAAAVDQSDSPSVVVVAQEGGSDEDSDTGLRLIDRQSTTRVDAVVIALWSIAAGMTVMLAVFLWHTSPRRRLRLARTRSAHLAEEAGEDAEDLEAEEAEEAEGDEDDSEAEGDDEPGEDAEDGEEAVVGEAEGDDEPDEDAEAGEESGDAGQSAASREAELSEVAAASREAEEAEEADEGAEDGEAEVDEDDSGQGFWPRPGDARGLD